MPALRVSSSQTSRTSFSHSKPKRLQLPQGAAAPSHFFFLRKVSLKPSLTLMNRIPLSTCPASVSSPSSHFLRVFHSISSAVSGRQAVGRREQPSRSHMYLSHLMLGRCVHCERPDKVHTKVFSASYYQNVAPSVDLDPVCRPSMRQAFVI